MMRLPLLLPLLLLGACANGESQPYHQPDNTIAVVPDGAGRLQAIGPGCVPFDDSTIDRYANDPLPQLGCAIANNLAQMIANPADLVRGELPSRAPSVANGGVEAAATARYEFGKTYPPAGPSSTADTTIAQ